MTASGHTSVVTCSCLLTHCLNGYNKAGVVLSIVVDHEEDQDPCPVLKNFRAG